MERRARGKVESEEEEHVVVAVTEEKVDHSEKGGGKGVEEIYNNNPDLRLLLDLLADSSGVPTAISILTLLDQVSLSLVGSPRDTLLSLVHDYSKTHAALCHKDTNKGTFWIRS